MTTAGHPLSYGQQRVWLLSEISHDDAALNLVMAVRLTGRLNLPALRQALNDVVARHEVLRAAIAVHDDDVRQLPAAGLTMPLRLVDLGGVASAVAGPQVEQALRQEARRPFTLASGPLVRTTVLTVCPTSHVVAVAMHHIVTDGWSMGLLGRELSALYGAYVDGRPGLTGTPAVQYRDFVAWQQTRATAPGPDLVEWVEGLSGMTGGGVPSGRHPDRDRTRQAAIWKSVLPPGLTNRLGDLRRREGGSLFMLLLTALMIVIYRIDGREDVAVGTFSAGRTRPEFEEVIGYFVNLLIIRARLGRRMTFRQAWKEIRDRCVEAYSHQDYPYEKLLGKLNPERDPQLTPPISALCVMQQPSPPIQLRGVQVEPVDVPHTSALFDLTVEISERAGRVELAFQYDIDVLDEPTVSLLARYLVGTLHSAVTDLDVTCGALSLEPPQRGRDGRVRSSSVHPPHPTFRPSTLHERFEEQAANAPDSVALSCEGAALTYAAVNAGANRLARHLVGIGVDLDDRVAVYLPRSLESVVTSLAILKAGAGFVPLDPADPPDRLAYLLEDSGATCVVTLAALADELTGPTRLVLLDRHASTVRAQTGGDLHRAVSGNNLAYLFYTSGSTGTPKGVLGTHQGMVNRLAWMRGSYPPRPGERACHRASPAYVDTVTELYGPLLSGIPVEILGEDEAVEPRRLVDALARGQITRIVTVPSLLRMLLDSVRDIGDRLRTPGVWVCGGERLPVDLAATFHARLPGHTLLHLYGSTEVAGDITALEIAADAEEVPIGRSIDNVTALVYEPDGSPAPPLVAGELWAGGVAAARGYHQRPAATAERFVPDPAGPSGSRAFRTADQMRTAADGALRFLGRLDDQIQIRGMRVEPGEAEEALRRHPQVNAAAVTGWPDASGSTTLAGYVVLRSSCPTSEIREFVRARLPPHLVPSILVEVASLPYTPSGKVDRHRLPRPETLTTGSTTAATPPRDPAERAVAEVFGDILPVRWRSVDDDFFELGGHSILAVAVVNRLREHHHAQLTMRDIFAARTIAAIARRIARHGPDTTARPLVARPQERHEPFPLTEVQQAYLVGRDSRFELGSVATHSYFEVDAPDLDNDRVQLALRRLIDRHPALRTVVRPDGLQQVMPDPPPYQLPVVELRDRPEEERRRVLHAIRSEMSHQVLPAGQWPLFDIRVSQLPARRGRLHVSIDALIADNLSVWILMDELAALYHDPDARLEPLELTFRDCVLADQAIKSSPAYDRAMTYWRQRLPDLPLGPELPLRRSPADIDQPRFERAPGTLDVETWGRLRKRAAAAGLTGAGALLGAFAEVLTAWSARPHYTLTLTLFNRDLGHPEVNRIVGDFTSLTLLEVDHRRPGTFLQRARRLQERLWEDLDHHQVSGVTVLREWSRLTGRMPGSLAPVVFTSNLGLGPDLVEGPAARARELGELGFALTQTPQLYLDHQVAESPSGLTLSWDVVGELFPPGLVEDMMGAYLRLLVDLADDDGAWRRPVADLTPRYQLQRRATVNQTARDVPTAALPDLVRRAAIRTPDAIAVVAGGQRLSYREVVARADRIAQQLRSRGTGPGELVGVAAGKGWQQVVAVLGITAAGAAYVPLDPELPPARMAELAERTRLRLALVQLTPGDSLVGLAGVSQLAIDDEAQRSAPSGVRPAGSVSAHNLAYVIFTSGSTGVPKGVMIDHRGAVNTIQDIGSRFEIGPGDRILGLSSLSFDLSVYDIFGILAAGGTLVLPDPGRLRDPGHWLELALRERVTVWNSVPALMGLAVEFAEARQSPGLRGLRRVLLSGDWIPLDLPDRLRRLAPAARVISLGGATEASIWSVCYPIEDVDPAWVSIPYGRPLANQRLYVLDQHRHPRPDWVPGDLYLGGDGLALGYWSDPRATASSFVADPTTGQRLYRTGDLARFLPDGNVEFLGREDHQVKISGYRVELGEIESVLLRAPGIASCAVIAVGPRRGEKRLAAFYVPRPEQTVDRRQLREHLRDHLPDYLVPRTLTELSALPLTGNGKVDHTALAERAVAQPPVPASAEVVGLQRSLAELWSQVLEVEQVGPTDNFFELGGSSLVAVRLVGALEEQYRVKIPLVRLYEYPTVAQLAAEIAGALGEAATPALQAEAAALWQPEPERRYEPFPLTDVQEAYWLGRQAALDLGGVATFSYVELDVADLDVDRLEHALQELIQRHDALRTVVQPDGLQRTFPQVPDYRISRLDVRDGPREQVRATLAGLRQEMSHQVLPADRWPLFDIRATRLDDRRTRLHLGLDLLLVDAFSFRILQQEILARYDSPEVDLPVLRCTFRDYVLAMLRSRDTESYRRAERYWADRLPDLPPAPRLPRQRELTDLVRPRFTRMEGAVAPDDWSGLRQLAASAKLTPSGLLCAAFAEVLAMWCQQSRFTLNLTTFDREPLHPDIGLLVGDFTSTTLLAVDATARTFTARAARLQQQIFEDLEHRRFGGVQVLRRLRADPARRLDALAPVVFTSMLVPEPHAAAPARPWDAQPAYSVSQTPQVLLDHQVYEDGGTLRYSWDHVPDAFPAGMVEAMFEAYGRLLRSLFTDGAYWEVPPAWT